jgi:hypothetical protein
MSEPDSAGVCALVSRDTAENAICNALRLFVGRGRRYSVKQLSNGTGVKDRMIEGAMAHCGHSDHRPLPSFALLSIASFLGADFTNEWLRLAHQGAFELPEGNEPKPGDLAVDNSDDNAVVTRAAMDGVFDDEERRVLPIVGARLMARGSQLVAMGGRAA